MCLGQSLQEIVTCAANVICVKEDAWNFSDDLEEEEECVEVITDSSRSSDPPSEADRSLLLGSWC